jgi:hypothetical protein
MADIDTTASLADEPRIARRTSPLGATSHMCKATRLLGNWSARAAGTGFAATVLLPLRIKPRSWPDIWFELWQMQNAVWQRQRQLQDDWMQGWLAWANECTQARGANTMSKLVEQEFDLVAQWQELLSDQATDMVSLLENLEVNYAYWVSEKLR